MKFYKLFVLTLAILLIFTSCATNLKGKNPDGSPVWTTNIPQKAGTIFGVGKAKFSNESNSQRAADANARADLAAKIKSRTQEAFAEYTYESEGMEITAMEDLLLEITNLCLEATKVEERWTAPDGTVWTLISTSRGNIKEILKESK